MPHKVTTLALVAEADADGAYRGRLQRRCCCALTARWLGDQFDGAGFVRGVMRKGRAIEGARAIVAGAAASVRRSPRRSLAPAPPR